ncbi:MAG: NAD(P)-binding domain-containing protein [Phycisphaerales bacterium]
MSGANLADVPGAPADETSAGFALRAHPRRGAAPGKSFRVRKLVLAIGNMHRPRALGIPGESLAHVSHYLADPHGYAGRRVLIVGGKNSAVEAAIRLYRVGARVTMSYRRAAFDGDRVKYWLLPEIEWLIRKAKIGFEPGTVPTEIRAGSAVLDRAGERVEVAADAVLLLTGYVQDPDLFDRLGVEREGDESRPVVNPRTMETNVRGVYVAGTAAGGSQKRATVFIETSHVHADRIAAAVTGREAGQEAPRYGAMEES